MSVVWAHTENASASCNGKPKTVKSVGPEGIEPSPPCGERILSAARLPIPPWSQRKDVSREYIEI